MAGSLDGPRRLEQRLAALKARDRSQPAADDALDLQEQLIRASLSAARPPEAPPFPLPRDHLVARVRQGVPLLHDQPAIIDVQFAADLFSRIVNVLQQRDQADLRSPLAALVEAATGGRLEPEALFREAFVHHPQHLAEIAAAASVDADLLAAVAAQATAPLLRAYAERLMGLLERIDDGTPDGAAWTRGYCPVCGRWPLLGELRGVELAQWLRCGACGSAWRAPRLACAYCGNDDYRSLGSLTIEGELRFRVAVCERCKGYLKVCNAFDPAPAELLALDDAASLHLDVAAIERGYQRPSEAGFSIELAIAEDEWVEELA
ncbi:MAG TPA: formate dehydrogenase accessory protein FdhE [Chloroflexota bacterium]